MSESQSATIAPALPAWASELASLYESGACNQFVLHGNTEDLFPVVSTQGDKLGTLEQFLMSTLLSRFDVVLHYDLGTGLKVTKGGEVFAAWPGGTAMLDAARQPRAAADAVTRYFHFLANSAALGRKAPQAALILRAAQLAVPPSPGGPNYDLNALALTVRDWSRDARFMGLPLATFLVVENLSDLHALLVNNPASGSTLIPLPQVPEIARALAVWQKECPGAFGSEPAAQLAPRLAGATLTVLAQLVKEKHYTKTPIADTDLSEMRKASVEKDCAGLVEFIEPTKNFASLAGNEGLKKLLGQDLSLWKSGDCRALPMGYLICGPVGTGKTFFVECLAGEAGVPVVKMKNFRDKWVGSTESNLEKIFRLLRALGRCFVFVDEADQALGKRDSGSNDAGLSGRVYSMFAKEMSDSSNRGKIIWLLASSRPDLIEVDLKRPGRVDVKVPLFPTANAGESWSLLRAMGKRYDLTWPEAIPAGIEPRIPVWLTPGAAEALTVKLYRMVHADKMEPLAALGAALEGYQPPIAHEVMDAQIALAAREASDADFVPPAFRSYIGGV